MYGLDRFSTDLDFDLLDRDFDIDTPMVQLLQKFGTLKRGKNIILSYAHDDDNIKVDINDRIWKSNRYETKNFYGTDLLVQTQDTIFSNKLVALTERNTNRDIYDVYFFLRQHWNINEAVIQERTGGGSKELFRVIIRKLKQLPENYKILDGLGEVLDLKQKAFVKEKLVKELVGMLEFEVG